EVEGAAGGPAEGVVVGADDEQARVQRGAAGVTVAGRRGRELQRGGAAQGEAAGAGDHGIYVGGRESGDESLIAIEGQRRRGARAAARLDGGRARAARQQAVARGQRDVRVDRQRAAVTQEHGVDRPAGGQRLRDSGEQDRVGGAGRVDVG